MNHVDNVTMTTIIVSSFLLQKMLVYPMDVQGVPEKNVPLGEGQASPKGTFFLGHLVHVKEA